MSQLGHSKTPVSVNIEKKVFLETIEYPSKSEMVFKSSC